MNRAVPYVVTAAPPRGAHASGPGPVPALRGGIRPGRVSGLASDGLAATQDAGDADSGRQRDSAQVTVSVLAVAGQPDAAVLAAGSLPARMAVPSVPSRLMVAPGSCLASRSPAASPARWSACPPALWRVICR